MIAGPPDKGAEGSSPPLEHGVNACCEHLHGHPDLLDMHRYVSDDMLDDVTQHEGLHVDLMSCPWGSACNPNAYSSRICRRPPRS